MPVACVAAGTGAGRRLRGSADPEPRLRNPRRAALNVDRPDSAGRVSAHRPPPRDSTVDGATRAEAVGRGRTAAEVDHEVAVRVRRCDLRDEDGLVVLGHDMGHADY